MSEVAQSRNTRREQMFSAVPGLRIANGWVADLFLNGTLGPQPVGNTVHGGIGLRVNY